MSTINFRIKYYLAQYRQTVTIIICVVNEKKVYTICGCISRVNVKTKKSKIDPKIIKRKTNG